MAHRKHRWQFETVYLTSGRDRIKGAVAVWSCRCNATTNREYTFRKPPPTAETAGKRERTVIENELAKWPNQEG